MSYGTALELRARIDKTGAADDATLTAIIAAAERNINRACNRADGFEADVVASARTYSGNGKPYLYVDECVEVTLVEVKDSASDTDYDAWAGTDWIACSGDPRSPNFNRVPYDMLMVDPTGDESVFTKGVPTVRVTARWGYSVVAPADIKEACLMQAARWFKRYQSAMADVLADGELGRLLYRQALDPDIRRILVDGRYVRPVVGRR